MYAPIRYLCAGTFSSDSPSYSQPLSAKSLNGAGTAYSSPFTVNLKPKTALSSAVDESDLSDLFVSYESLPHDASMVNDKTAAKRIDIFFNLFIIFLLFFNFLNYITIFLTCQDNLHNYF